MNNRDSHKIICIPPSLRNLQSATTCVYCRPGPPDVVCIPVEIYPRAWLTITTNCCISVAPEQIAKPKQKIKR